MCKQTATAPLTGEKTIPPRIAATSREPLCLVWRSRPQSAKEKMVAKQHWWWFLIDIGSYPSCFITHRLKAQNKDDSSRFYMSNHKDISTGVTHTSNEATLSPWDQLVRIQPHHEVFIAQGKVEGPKKPLSHYLVGYHGFMSAQHRSLSL